MFEIDNIVFNPEEIEKLITSGKIPQEFNKQDLIHALHLLIADIPEKDLSFEEEIDTTEVEKYIHDKISEYTQGEMVSYIEPSFYDDKIYPETILTAYNKYCESKKEISFSDFLYSEAYDMFNQEVFDMEESYLFNRITEDIEYQDNEDLKKQFEALKEKKEDYWEILKACGYETTGINIPAFLNADYKINIMFGTASEQDFDMSSITDIYRGTDIWDNVLKDSDKFKKVADTALSYLIHQQGYTVEEALKDYYNKNSSNSKFIKSITNEINNQTYQMGELTALVTANGSELIELLDHIANSKDYIEMPKDTMLGIYNEWSGSGSVLEIELEKPLVIPCNMVRNLQMEGARKQNNGYTVNEVYGLIESCWKAKAFITKEAPELKKEDLTIPRKFLNEVIHETDILNN